MTLSAADGTRSSPGGPCCSPSFSKPGAEAVARTGTGRVCATAAGIAPRLTHSTTPSLTASSMIASPSSRQRKSGSGPDSTNVSLVPRGTCRTAIWGHVSRVRVPSITSSTGRRDR